MENFKKAWKTFWAYVWECYKGSFLSGFTYVLAGAILMMLTIKDDVTWSTQMTWTIVVCVCAVAYNALVSYNYGGMNFEMLISGNMKRMSADYGQEYKISSHSYVKEYRPWKGFAMGAFASGLAIIFGILFGIMQEKVDLSHTGEIQDKSVGLLVLLGFFLSGWSILPFYCANMWGMGASYWLSLLMAIIPIAVTGATYIWGAYGKRNKITREQEIADRAAKAQENKPKKINYGGLPGTKPRKRK